MKCFYKIFLFLILISFSTSDDKITVTVQATSGIINKVKYSKAKYMDFDIAVQVNQNITNKISIIDISVNVKNPEDNKIFPANCNIAQVRLEEDDYGDTQLNCYMNYSEYTNDDVDEDMNLVIDGQFSYSSDVAEFVFENFTKIGTHVKIGGLHIYNLEKDSCTENSFKFEMNFTGDYDAPLESTVCEIQLNNNEVHSVTNCAIPVTSNMLLCYIDVSEKKITKAEKIEINAQENSKCQNGQVVTIEDDAQNILEMEVDCDKMHFLVYNIINILFLILILL
jgi:hypothetical protein